MWDSEYWGQDYWGADYWGEAPFIPPIVVTDPDLAISIREAILGDMVITPLLSTYLGDPAVFTRTPVPGGADYPMIVISRNVIKVNQDGVHDYRPTVAYQIATYGKNSAPPEQYRAISTIAYEIRTLLHRQHNLSLTDWTITDQVCSGPVDQPSADQITARVVTLTARLAQLAA